MEWVETTGRTVDEALEGAFDQLGVAPEEVEYEVLEEPKPGLFGKVRVEARVRARIRPVIQRSTAPKRVAVKKVEEVIAPSVETAEPPAGSTPPKSPRKPRKAAVEAPTATADVPPLSDDLVAVVDVAKSFLAGLMEVLSLSVTFEVAPIDERTVQVGIHGQQLGFLVGQGAKTLEALQELTRTAVHQALGDRGTRLMLDVAGYRAKRRQALEQFTLRVGGEVKEAQRELELEPMSAVDRKVIHDTVNSIDGLRSTSRGEDPSRFVVLIPE